jgi:hypothetical protein
MDQDKALAILKSLAEGIDPHGGGHFPPDSPYQRPDVVRALYTAVECNQTKAVAKAGPTNAGKPWSKEEDALLLAGFSAGHGIEALAAKHGRSRTGIEARLAKYGKVSLSSPLLSNRIRARQPMAAYNSHIPQ